MTLNEEIAAYDRMRADLESKHMGKWALFHNHQLFGVYGSFEAAKNAVSKRGPYLIRQIGASAIAH